MRIPEPELPVTPPAPDPSMPEMAWRVTTAVSGDVTATMATVGWALGYRLTTTGGAGVTSDFVRLLSYRVTTSGGKSGTRTASTVVSTSAANLYTRRCTDFWGVTFQNDVAAVTGVDDGYACVVKTRNAPVAVYSVGGALKATEAQYRVDDWTGATLHTAPGITGQVLSACTPTPGVIMALVSRASTRGLYTYTSFDQGATWITLNASAVTGLTDTHFPSAARLLVNDEPFGHVVLCYIDPATGYPGHKVTRNLGMSWA